MHLLMTRKENRIIGSKQRMHRDHPWAKIEEVHFQLGWRRREEVNQVSHRECRMQEHRDHQWAEVVAPPYQHG
jgi:hypothetical protein